MLPFVPRRPQIREAASVALLTLAVVAFFWPLILGGAWLPRGGGDLVSFLWPMVTFAARSLRSGIVPLWNPHLYSGAPFVADNQSAVFYPINLLVFGLSGSPSYAVMETLVVLHIWIAAVGTYVLLRSLRLRRSAAIFGALAFALSDLFVTHIGNLNLNATAAWLPWILWATHRALARRQLAWAAASGALLAVAALAGHAQMLLFVGLALALYIVCYLVAHAARGRPWQETLRPSALTALIVAVGFAGAALTLLPAWRLAQHTGRGHLSYAEATRYSLPPRALVGLLAPGFYGRGPAAFWGPWERVEVGYAGVATLPLAALGVLFTLSQRPGPAPRTSFSPDRPPAQEHRSAFRYFALLVPVALLLAMGDHTPVYRLLYRFAPTFDQIRAPARLVFLADLGLAALAARGLDELLARQPCRHWQLGLAIATCTMAALLLAVGLPQARSLPPPDRAPLAIRSVIIAATLLGTTGLLLTMVRYRPWAQWLLPALLAVDLIALGSTVEIDRSDPTAGFRHPSVVRFLEQDPSLFRIEDAASAWQPSAALTHGLQDIGGVYNPLALAPYEAYRWAIGDRGSPRYNLLNVKYLLVDKGQAPGHDGLELVHTGRKIDVYRNPAALPRALFVTREQVVPNHHEAWRAIHAPTFDPSRVVVLEESSTLAAAPALTSQHEVHLSFLHYGLNRVRLRVQSGESGWLVLSDVFYPGWQATLNGQPAPLLRANYTFRAVSVPAGDHLVEMRFAPSTWRVGLALSLATWLALAAAATWRYIASRSPHPL